MICMISGKNTTKGGLHYGLYSHYYPHCKCVTLEKIKESKGE